MTALWFLPVIVTLLGIVAAVVAGAMAADEAARLRRELRAVAGLRPLLAEVRVASRSVRIPQTRAPRR